MKIFDGASKIKGISGICLEGVSDFNENCLISEFDLWLLLHRGRYHQLLVCIFQHDKLIKRDGYLVGIKAGTVINRLSLYHPGRIFILGSSGWRTLLCTSVIYQDKDQYKNCSFKHSLNFMQTYKDICFLILYVVKYNLLTWIVIIFVA